MDKEEFKIKHLRDEDTADKLIFLKYYAVVFLGIYIVLGQFVIGQTVFGLRIGQLLFFVLDLAVSAVVTGLAFYLSGKVSGGAVNRLFGLKRNDIKPEEQYGGNLDQARHLKHKEEYDRALEIVNETLRYAPDFPEALYLKAQILYEGYGNVMGAKAYLERVIELIPDPEKHLHRWAATLYERISGLRF